MISHTKSHPRSHIAGLSTISAWDRPLWLKYLCPALGCRPRSERFLNTHKNVGFWEVNGPFRKHFAFPFRKDWWLHRIVHYLNFKPINSKKVETSHIMCCIHDKNRPKTRLSSAFCSHSIDGANSFQETVSFKPTYLSKILFGWL